MFFKPFLTAKGKSVVVKYKTENGKAPEKGFKS